MPQNGQQSSKQPYTTPSLITYGDVLKITEASKAGPKFDGKGFDRTA